MKKVFLSLLICACAAEPELSPVGKTSAISGLTSPNIVVIMADDLDTESMQLMIDLNLAPNIKNYLYTPGTRFPNYFVSNSLCCPSRATMLSGQYSHNHGVETSVASDPNGGVDAFNDTSTLVTWLQAIGYRTGHAGKYLNGYGTEQNQFTPSFQDTYVPPGWNRWMATVGAGTYKMFDYQIHDTVDGVVSIESHGTAVADYQTTVLAAKSVDFINEAVDLDTPFYLEVTPVAPHATTDTVQNGKWDFSIPHDPQDDIDKPAALAVIDSLPMASESKPSFDVVSASQPSYVSGNGPLTETNKTNLRDYYHDRLKAMLAVDDLVGDVFQTLEERGVLGNTVVFFTSDNGFLFGEHRLAGKRLPYDESTRAPLYIRMPVRDMVEPPRLIVNADLAPTIVELTGAAPGLVMDGRSLVPFLDPAIPVPTWRQRLLVEHWQRNTNDVPTYSGIRTTSWLFVDYYAAVPAVKELYDLTVDPYQTNNVYMATGYIAPSGTLQTKLDAIKSCAGSGCITAEQ